MDNTTERNTGNWVYSGEKLKNFLHRKGISYKDAAKELGIDKNTVGKAVRGGNLNVDIILRICNVYGLCAHDFFTYKSNDETSDTTNYYLSSYSNHLTQLSSAEPEINYKKSKNSSKKIQELSEGLEQIKALITELSDRLNKEYALLNEIKKDNE